MSPIWRSWGFPSCEHASCVPPAKLSCSVAMGITGHVNSASALLPARRIAGDPCGPTFKASQKATVGTPPSHDRCVRYTVH